MARLSTYLLAIAAAAVVVSGCKKPEAAQATATPENNPANASTTPAPTPAPAAELAAPVQQQPVAVVDPSSGLSQANQALKAKDYDKAAATLLAIQQQQLNDQQAAAVHQQMVKLQSALVSAISSGDPNAKAAGD